MFEIECHRCLNCSTATGDVMAEIRRLVDQRGWLVLPDGTFVCYDCRVEAMIQSLENANVIAAAGK